VEVSLQVIKYVAAGFALAAALFNPQVPRAAEKIVIYHALDFVGSAAKAFAKKTGIEVQLVEQASTGEVLGKISAEGDRPQYDLVWLEGSAVMERLAAGSKFAALPELAKDVDYTESGKKLMPASGHYFPTNVSTTAIAVNTKKVPAAEMPKAWGDLAKFSGSVAAKDPNLSGPAFQWLAGVFQTDGQDKGEAMLKAVLTNKALSGLPSGGSVNKALLTGNAKVAIAQDSATYSKMAKGEPLAVVYPTDGVIALPSSIAVSAKTAHMDAAKRFVAFVLSKEGQAAMLDGDDADFFFMPVINGVAAKSERKTDVSFVFLDDKLASSHEMEWKKWYRDNFVP
jgi:iron(III) transport system substrate-binding protein